MADSGDRELFFAASQKALQERRLCGRVSPETHRRKVSWLFAAAASSATAGLEPIALTGVSPDITRRKRLSWKC